MHHFQQIKGRLYLFYCCCCLFCLIFLLFLFQSTGSSIDPVIVAPVGGRRPPTEMFCHGVLSGGHLVLVLIGGGAGRQLVVAGIGGNGGKHLVVVPIG